MKFDKAKFLKTKLGSELERKKKMYKRIRSKDKGIVKLEVTVKSGTMEDNKKILQEIRQMVRKLNRNEKKYGYVVEFKENA